MVSRSGALIAVSLVLLAGASLAIAKDTMSSTKYSIKGDELEGCECTSVCPCIFSADATADQCRGIVG